MDRRTLIGTLSFTIFAALLGLGSDMGLELAGVSSQWAASVAMNLCVVPLALFAARRVGRITHLSLLVAGVVLALLGWCVVVFALNSIAASTGGRFGWEDLLNPGNWRNTVFGSLVVIAAPKSGCCYSTR
jgi:hypothetical protein